MRKLTTDRGWRRLVAGGLVLVVVGLFSGGGAGLAVARTAPVAAAAADTSTGGADNAVTIDVTGSPLTDVTSSPVALTPSWSAADTDYVWYCASGTNDITLDLSSAGTITSGSQSGSQLSIAVTVVANQAVVVTGPDGTQYWIRCLPSTFPHLTIGGAGDAAPAYYLTGAYVNTKLDIDGYPMILNSHGTPVWYIVGSPAPGGQNVELLPGTHTVAWASGDWDDDYYNLYNLDTDTLSTLDPPVAVPDAHELYTDTAGDHWMISRPLSTTDPETGQPWNLSSIGFSSIHSIVDCVVQELSPSGSTLWEWDAQDYVSPDESTHLASEHEDEGQPAVDVYHCNSIDVDPLDTDNILVSMRDAGVYDIDKATGVPEWKLGGTQVAPESGEPQLRIVGDPETTISGQHDARFQPNGDVSMFDDHTTLAGAARGVEYAIDTTNDTATMDFEYQNPSGDDDASMGSFRRYDANMTTYDQSGSAYQGPVENVIDWGHGAPSTGFTVVDNAGDDLLDVTFPTNVLGNRATLVPLSALDLSELRDSAGTAYPSVAAPTVTSVTPDPVGQGATFGKVLVHGTNFSSDATVSLSAASIDVESTTYVSSTELKLAVHIPQTATVGAGDVTVTTPAGSATCAGCLTVDPYPDPTGVSVSPAPGTTTTLTVTGSSFQSGLAVKTSVPGATLSAPTDVTATSFEISVTVPSSDTAGKYKLTVTNPDGGIGNFTKFKVT